AAALNAAAKSADLAAFCRTKAKDTRALARKGLMAQRWLFANALPKDEKLNREFQSDLAMSGVATSPDRKAIVGVMLGGEQVHRDHATAFIRNHLAQAILMDALGGGKPPRVKELAKLIGDAQQEIVRELEGRYGKPEPLAPKEESK